MTVQLLTAGRLLSRPLRAVVCVSWLLPLLSNLCLCLAETRPNLATRMRLSIPAPLSQQPPSPQVPIFLFSALVLSAFSHFFFCPFFWWSHPTERVPASASVSPLQTASGELEVSSGRREKVAVGCSAGPEGVGGSEVSLQQDGRRGLLLFHALPPLPLDQQRDHYGLLIQLRSEEILVSGGARLMRC